MELNIGESEKLKFIGQIIDILDDLLEERDVYIPTSVREMIQDGDTENAARIYGKDYGELEQKIEKLLMAWSNKDTPVQEGVPVIEDRQAELKARLSNGGALVAYNDANSDYPGAGIQYEAPDGCQYDIVLVEAEGPAEEYDPDILRVYVYADNREDDYTDKFMIPRDGFNPSFASNPNK